MDREQAHRTYAEILNDAKAEGGAEAQKQAMALLASKDLFFLLVRVLNRIDVDCDFLYRRCREVQANPNGFMDLWAREHRKSTIITYGLTIQDIINDPDIRIAIFSITKTEAEKFLGYIKQTCENNPLLHELWPDVFWADPLSETRKLSQAWSRQKGLVFKRSQPYAESTVECWGLDAMPTGRHFQIRVYDDVINENHVTNPEMIAKAMDGWRLSTNLGSDAPIKHYKELNIRRIIGTRYHMNDPYGQIMKENIAVPRIYPATDNGRASGRSVYLPEALLLEKRKEQGPYHYACQMLQNPRADSVQGFNLEWVHYRKIDKWNHMNRYILVDPASEKGKKNDYTVMLVLGLGPDNNYYLLDGVRDRLNLTERTNTLIRLHKQYTPIKVGYEKVGMQSDIEHIEYVQDLEHYRFQITVMKCNYVNKNDQIRKLVPVFEQGRFILPLTLPFLDYEGKSHDLVREFVQDELLTFPLGSHDDILDTARRVLDPDLGATFPRTETQVYHGAMQQKAKTDYDELGGM